MITTEFKASNSDITNDIVIDNLPANKCSIDKLTKYFHSKKKSGIKSCKGIEVVENNMAILHLEDDKGIMCFIIISKL